MTRVLGPETPPEFGTPGEVVSDSSWSWDGIEEDQPEGEEEEPAEKGFDPARHPRGWHGRFAHDETAEPFPEPPRHLAPHVKDLSSPGRPDGAGTAADPIDVQGNLDRALVLMAQGKHVRLNQPDEVGTLVDRINDLAAKFKDNGGKLPTIDLGKLTVKGTNLFAAEHKGIPRIQMPQLGGIAKPGTEAARVAGGPGKFADMIDAFKKKLVSDGIGVRDEVVHAAHLRATQMELDGEKVAAIVRAYQRGDPFVHKMMAEPLWVTRDNYVIDGHHRWAADMVLDALDGKLANDMPQAVRSVNMDIGAAIPYANAYADAVGLGHVAVGEGAALVQKMLIAYSGETGFPADVEPTLENRALWNRIGTEIDKIVREGAV